jgi:hypothetical protein
MKHYILTIIGGHGSWNAVVEADNFQTDTSLGYYAFYKAYKLIACYPIDRTIITRIEEVDNK